MPPSGTRASPGLRSAPPSPATTAPGDNEWSTEATIVELAENERFFFNCAVGDFVFAKWGYVIEPSDAGSLVTEYSQNLIPEEMREAAAGISGVEDRTTHNRGTMETTLDRLAATLE